MFLLAITLLAAGALAGCVNLFVNYFELPFSSSGMLKSDDWPKPRKLWIAVVGYISVGTAGAFLTPLLDAILGGLKGFKIGTEYDYLVAFGYGIVFGYSTNRLLLTVLDSILKRVLRLEQQTDKGEGDGSIQKSARLSLTVRTTDLKEGEHYPANKSEVQASGAFAAKITRGTTEFKNLKTNTNSDIVFKDEELTGADKLMNAKLYACLNTLAAKVKQEWRNGANPKYKLRVTEAWDEDNEHAAGSLHYEARAADINLYNISTGAVDTANLGRLSALAIDSGFDWIWYEDSSHVHVSCKK